jgi:hypothetical protein
LDFSDDTLDGYLGSASAYPGVINEWDAAIEYDTGDIVVVGFTFFIATAPNVSTSPPSSKWNKLIN